MQISPVKNIQNINFKAKEYKARRKASKKDVFIYRRVAKTSSFLSQLDKMGLDDLNNLKIRAALFLKKEKLTENQAGTLLNIYDIEKNEKALLLAFNTMLDKSKVKQSERTRFINKFSDFYSHTLKTRENDYILANIAAEKSLNEDIFQKDITVSKWILDDTNYQISSNEAFDIAMKLNKKNEYGEIVTDTLKLELFEYCYLSVENIPSQYALKMAELLINEDGSENKKLRKMLVDILRAKYSKKLQPDEIMALLKYAKKKNYKNIPIILNTIDEHFEHNKKAQDKLSFDYCFELIKLKEEFPERRTLTESFLEFTRDIKNKTNNPKIVADMVRATDGYYHSRSFRVDFIRAIQKNIGWIEQGLITVYMIAQIVKENGYVPLTDKEANKQIHAIVLENVENKQNKKG